MAWRCVHRDRSSQSPGNTRKEFVPCQSFICQRPDQRTQGNTGAAFTRPPETKTLQKAGCEKEKNTFLTRPSLYKKKLPGADRKNSRAFRQEP
jgi:hypothetical protein